MTGNAMLFHRCLAPLYVTSRIIGLAPLKWRRGVFVESSVGKIHGWLMLAIIVIWFIFTAAFTAKSYPSFKHVHGNLIYPFLLLSILRLLSGSTTLFCYARSRFSLTLAALRRADCLLHPPPDIARRRQHGLKRQVIFWQVVDAVAIAINYSVELYVFRDVNLNIALFLFFVQFFGNVMLLHHFVLVSMIKMRFSLLNDCLEDLEQQQENKCKETVIVDDNFSVLRKTQNGIVTFPFLVLAGAPQGNPTPEIRRSEINHLRQAHLHLCDAVDQVNRHFGPCLLSESATMFVSAVHCVHGVVNIATVDYASALFGSNARMLQIVAFFVFVCVLMRVVRCSQACHRAAAEAERTSGPLLRMLPHSAERGDVGAEKQLRMFLQQLLHVKVHFSAHGLFTLDNRFTFGFISAMFTYCLILVQLK